MEQTIIEVLEFCIQKLKNNECTREQLNAASKAVAENLDIYATAKEIARHYGKSTDAVHGVIKRRMIAKPRRNITLYSFKAFQKIVPSSWRTSH